MHATAFFADRVKNTPVWVMTFMSIIGICITWLFTGIFTRLFREKRAFPMAVYLAIIPTFLINTLIYGGYKTIGFGLVLALAMGMVSCYGQYSRQTQDLKGI